MSERLPPFQYLKICLISSIVIGTGLFVEAILEIREIYGTVR